MTALTEADRLVISRGRQLAGVIGPDAVCMYTGRDDIALAYAEALGEAQHLLAELAAIAGRPDGATEDTRRLREIRVLLARFDWGVPRSPARARGHRAHRHRWGN